MLHRIYHPHTILIVAALIGSSYASLRCDCTRAKCNNPTDCRAGTVYDQCSCCRTCAKAEGEICGGMNHVEGECGEGMQCMVRDVRSKRNRMKRQIQELIGRCEYYACHMVRCPVGQACAIVNGRPTCTCPMCRDMVTEEVCGEADGKLYKSECELRRQECLTRRRIGLAPAPCVSKAASRVLCNENSITLELTKSYLGVINFDRLSLMDPQCTFEQNSTHIYKTFGLNECGTQMMYTLTSVVYSNVVRTVENPNSIIIRRKGLQVPFECDYSLRSRNWNRIRITTNGNVGKLAEERLRRNGAGVRIRSKRKSETESNLGIDINSAERYLVELKASALQSVAAAVMPRYCYASPVHREERWMKYSLVENGCPVENGVELLDAEHPVIRISVPNIRFKGSKKPGFLVRCKVKACFASDPKKRVEMCTPKCSQQSRKRRSLHEEFLIDQLLLTGKPIMVKR